jgi:MraZ protein
VETGHLFSGNALDAVGQDGRVRLPPFVLETLSRRSDGRRIVFGAHESAPCLIAYDPGHRRALSEDVERRRRLAETLGLPDEDHHARARRAFGFAEEADYDARGRVALPRMMRRRARIADLAFFVGTGGAFEIWDPALAREAGGEALREMAEYRLWQREREDAR